MNPLARGNSRLSLRIVFPSKRVRKWTRGIDDATRGHLVFGAGFFVHKDEPVDQSIAILEHTHDSSVIQNASAMLHRGLGQIDEQPAVIKLPVVIEHSAAQSVLSER